jgi:hypothetical protein
MNRNIVIAIGGLVVIGGLAGFLLTRGTSEEKVAIPSPTPKVEIELLSSDALDVTFKPGTARQYTLTIDGIPEGVSAISYEITYDTTNKGIQGVVGSPIALKEGQMKYVNDKLIFGTCSRGKCVFDEGVNNIQINIRLTYKDGSEKGWKGTFEI